MLVEGNVVNIEAVIVAVDTTVLRVLPHEGVVASGDVEDLLTPGASTSVAALLDTVDVEVTIIPAAFAGDLAEEAHQTVGRNVHRNRHVADHVGYASAAALHAVGAFIRVSGCDGPRIGGIHLPIEQAEVASLEGLDDLATRQAAAPVHLHIRALRIQAVGIVLSNDTTDGIEVLVKDVVDRAGRLVVDHDNRVALDRSLDGLVTFLSSLAIIVTSVDVTAVVTLSVGREVVGVVHVELVNTNHRHSGASDTSRTVLFIDVTVNVAVTRDLHSDRI